MYIKQKECEKVAMDKSNVNVDKLQTKTSHSRSASKSATGRKNKRSNSRNNKKTLFNNGLLKFVAVALIIGCVVLIVDIETDCSEKESELQTLQTELDACLIENAELQRTLESDDFSAYMERYALEKRGYAYPDERRFYDRSRN